MALTEEQQYEMYADIKVIKNNCIICRKCIDDHERRLKFLERAYWVFFGVLSIVMFILKAFKW